MSFFIPGEGVLDAGAYAAVFGVVLLLGSREGAAGSSAVGDDQAGVEVGAVGEDDGARACGGEAGVTPGKVHALTRHGADGAGGPARPAQTHPPARCRSPRTATPARCLGRLGPRPPIGPAAVEHLLPGAQHRVPVQVDVGGGTVLGGVGSGRGRR
ncbi:hypothetical protein GCM10009639_09470 [Kitasatospora putterlickiae]|uniref:Uncharacterized protein n=1 Tax=Kitasatospora putterlickiae TaxID=221725 RepID=A0ABN1XP10_9ACTN